MTKTEIYLLLFTDSLFANIAINFSQEMIFYAIKAFNTISKESAIAIATCASFCAASLNYLLGRVVFNIFDSRITEGQRDIQEKRMFVLTKYKNLFLLFIIVPIFGKFIIVAAGFSRFPVVTTLVFCTALQIFYYTYIMYS